VDIRTWLVVLAVLTVFGGVSFWMIWSARRGHRDRARMATVLGFKPLEQLDQETSSRLISLHRHTHTQELKVSDAAERIEGTSRMILFDLMDYGGDSVSTLVNAGIAMISDDLKLPRFSLIPRVVEKGRLADISNRFLEMLIEKRSNRIQLGKNSFFEERYFLLGDDVHAIEEILDEYRLSCLAQFAYRHLEADGGVFTYSRFVFTTRAERNVQADIKRDIAEARRLLELFSSSKSA
jgi:hypothetical protein